MKRFIPRPLISLYHRVLALLGAIYYGFPSSAIHVIAITGTKGKTSTSEMVNAIFEEAGKKTALINSIRIKVDEVSEPNPSGRSMPGRAYLQQFFRRAVRKQCSVAIVEMTSEGARQHRHRNIQLSALAFLNIAPEHIESHGSFRAYADAKFAIGKQLVRSPKRPRIIVANAEDPESARYLSLPVETRVPFSLTSHAPWDASSRSGTFTFHGRIISVPQPGEFSLKNALAAAEIAHAFRIDSDTIARGLAKVTHIPGRAERIEVGQDFTVIVDYAHTPESLAALCDAYKGQRKICVLGSAGGGRDTWKRPVMGKTAEEKCDVVILTNDDSYDEDPQKIISDIRNGMAREPVVLLDRREAIRYALGAAKHGDAVLITGKGVDPMYGKGGVKTAWNDADVAREELLTLLSRAV